MESQVVVTGYPQKFLVNPTVKVMWNGQQIGTVSRNGEMSFDIDADGELSFKSSARKSQQVRIRAGQVTRVQLQWDRVSGQLSASVVAQEVDAAELREALKSDRRDEVLPTLIALAQSSPQVLDLLIEDAIARGDLVAADHWQTRKTQILEGPREEEKGKGRKKKGGSSTWTGFIAEVPMD